MFHDTPLQPQDYDNKKTDEKELENYFEKESEFVNYLFYSRTQRPMPTCWIKLHPKRRNQRWRHLRLSCV